MRYINGILLPTVESNQSCHRYHASFTISESGYQANRDDLGIRGGGLYVPASLSSDRWDNIFVLMASISAQTGRHRLPTLAESSG